MIPIRSIAMISILAMGAVAMSATRKEPEILPEKGVELKTASGRSERFVEATPETATATGLAGGNTTQAGRVFYKNGVVSQHTKYVTTGRIIVRFKGDVDYEAFGNANGLKFVKVINPRKATVLFENPTEKNDVELSGNVMSKEGVLYATPDWVLPIRLY